MISDEIKFFFFKVFRSWIPLQIGIGGIGSIVVGCLYAAIKFGAFYDFNIPKAWVCIVGFLIGMITLPPIFAILNVTPATIEDKAKHAEDYSKFLVGRKEREDLFHARELEKIRAAQPTYIQPMPHGWRVDELTPVEKDKQS